jgi:ABC-type uncharacterized transport system fused permease/ATPase subunit
MKFSNIILSWDFVISIVLTLATAIFLPTMLKMSFCISFYNTGITVLSIVFSLFFAALAIIMTSSDNEFIEFLEEKNDFSALLCSFKITLAMLFLSLIYAIVLYISSDYFLKNNDPAFEQHKIFFLVFEFLFAYSLLSTALSVRDTIKFSDFRGQFLKMKKKE